MEHGPKRRSRDCLLRGRDAKPDIVSAKRPHCVTKGSARRTGHKTCRNCQRNILERHSGTDSSLPSSPSLCTHLSVALSIPTESRALLAEIARLGLYPQSCWERLILNDDSLDSDPGNNGHTRATGRTSRAGDDFW